MNPRLFTIDMPEELWHIFPKQIGMNSYWPMIITGITLSFIFLAHRLKKFGVSKKDLTDLFATTIIGGFIGAKFIYYLQSPTRYIAQPSLIFQNLDDGFVFYGALLFSIPVLIYWFRKWNLPIKESLDIFAFTGAITQIFGRIGCFLSGCCYGKVCSNFLGVVFTDPECKAQPLGVPLYPTQLFDISLNLIILLTLFYVEKRKKFQGQLAIIYIVMYAIGRSIVEIYRGDAERGFVFDLLSYSQFIALILIGASIFFWSKWSNNKFDIR